MKKLLFLLVLFTCLFRIPGKVLAADFGAGVASTYLVSDPQATTSDILSSTTNGIYRSKEEYDMKIFGVIVDTATVIIRSVDPNYKPIAQSGSAKVSVTDINGPIKRGDYVTTSAKTPGKGQRATLSGYVLGTALEDLNGSNGVILVGVNPQYAEISNARTMSRLMDYFTVGLFRNIKDEGQFPMVMRYIMAGLIMLVTAIISFITFSRSVPKAIEAIGRNPLAKSSILLSLALSIGLVVITLGVGLVAAIVIIRV
ncbi:hypothetical protein HY310_01375 [Candidatus Microgenomates bacterium]|nr:hypothetical protein [Candidatus Microgenomates bacterium]